MSTPEVSVILPTYRRQRLLPRAIQSVLSQTHSDWELLVIDDEPSLETRDVVMSYGDSRIAYIGHDRNRGLSAARNTGIRAARAKAIAFLDDDDCFLETKLEKQLAELNGREDVGVVSCFEEVERTRGDTVYRRVRLDGDVRKSLLLDDQVRMQLLMVRSECFDRIGLFDERLRHHEDYDMTLRLARAFRFSTVPEALIRIIETPGSLSVNTRNRISALQVIMLTHPEFREIRTVRGRWERRLARHFAEVGDHAEWRRHMMKSLAADPLDVRTVIAFAAGLVFGPSIHSRLGRTRGRMARSRRDVA